MGIRKYYVYGRFGAATIFGVEKKILTDFIKF
jgi:hypothetical protein